MTEKEITIEDQITKVEALKVSLELAEGVADWDEESIEILKAVHDHAVNKLNQMLGE